MTEPEPQTSSPGPPMHERWRRRLVWVGLAIAGGAVALMVIKEVFVIPRRAELITRWDDRAVTAVFVRTDPDANGGRTFTYLMTNNTDAHYVLETYDRPRLFALRQMKGTLTLDDASQFTIDLPIFLPPKQSQAVRIRSVAQTTSVAGSALPADSRKALGNLGGFRIYDEMRQLAIDCPKGW